MSPFFSIIIPTLNEEKNIAILLTSIMNQTYADFEVVVVDSGSNDSTQKVAESFKEKITHLRFLEHLCKNVSSARNFGASNVHGYFLIFFDADVEIEDNFLKNIREKIEQYNLDATTVWNRSKDGKFPGAFLLNLMNVNMSLFQKIKPAANGPCIIIKKELFEKIKGFDISIVFGEDFHLIQKAHKLHAKFMVFKTPILYVSTRRFEKEGLLLSLSKSLKAIAYQLFFGPIRKPLFKYEMGGQYYKEGQNPNS
jgi:glycosyltransferase involved in cell wall biosynthesis